MIKISEGVNRFSLLAIPFFVLAGAIMAEGGMARRLVNLAFVLVGWIRGGLALVNILASSFFGCISGSSVADTASIGTVMIPQMVKAGYPRVFATNVTICGSVQAILIPPSHNAVIYSLAAGGTISIAAPVHRRRLPRAAARPVARGPVPRDRAPRELSQGRAGAVSQGGARRRSTRCGDWARCSSSWAASSPASSPRPNRPSVACVYAFLVTMFIYRDYKWRDLPTLVHRTVKTVAMVMILIGFASAFGYMMAIMQLPAKLTGFFLTVSDNKYVILLLINIMLLFLGTLMDLAPLLLICTPILLPVVKTFGVDPLHFGMIMMVNLGIGLVTPPVGTRRSSSAAPSAR